MVDPELKLPQPRQIASPADFASVGLWAAQQRFELSRLAKELRSLESAVDATDGGTGETHGEGHVPTSLAPALDALLDAAMGQLDARVDAAREEARALVAAATREATVLLTAVGADASTVRRVTTRSPQVAPVLRRPRGASELLCSAEAGGAARPVDAPDASWVPDSAPEDEMAPSFDDGDDVAGRDVSQMHDLFWAGALSDRPVRERLRRFGQRSSS